VQISFFSPHPKPIKPETRRRKIRNQKKTRNPKKIEKNSFTKYDGHPNPTRNPTGSDSGAKFHPWV
jgi:hypothetical protein